MSKAEDLAKKAYPEGDTYIFGDASIVCQVAYIKGYRQAEKDLELGWEDMRNIYDLAYNLRFPHKKQKEFFEEVLKRFKEKRNDTR